MVRLTVCPSHPHGFPPTTADRGADAKRKHRRFDNGISIDPKEAALLRSIEAVARSDKQNHIVEN